MRYSRYSSVSLYPAISMRRARCRGFLYTCGMHDLLRDAAQRAAEYRKTVGARPVAPNREALARLALLDES
ncbi:MAG: hypothetical protein ACE14T_09505, partial [Syntrophales bacterium]